MKNYTLLTFCLFFFAFQTTVSAKIPTGLDRWLPKHAEAYLKKLAFEPNKLLKVNSLSNGSFENDFTNWTIDGFTSIPQNYFGINPTDGQKQAQLITWTSTDATLETFLGIPAGSIDVAAGAGQNATVGTAIKQTITANAGDVLKFSWNFMTSEGAGSTYNDFAFFTILNNPIKLADTFSPLVASSSPFYLQTGYQTFTFVFPVGGTFTLGFGVMNEQDGSVNASLLIDRIVLCAATNAVPVGSGTLNVVVNEDAPNTALNMFNYFADSDTPDSELSYTMVGNTNPALFSSVVLTNNNFEADYAPDANGTAFITIQADDKCGHIGQTIFKFTVNPVNDPPNFSIGDSQTINEDAGAQTVTNWATGISAGPANESSQVLTFLVAFTLTPNMAFTVAPSINPSTGTLTYTPAPNAFGIATVTVALRDDQNAQTFPQTFTITANSVNDAPTFTLGTAPTILEDAGTQTLSGWATAISAGATNENGQALTFITSIVNAGGVTFTASPDIDEATGTLTYAAAPNSYGTAQVQVILQDNGGTANGGTSQSAIKNFDITVTAVNDQPTLANLNNTTVVPNAPEQTVNLSNISAGTNEASQTLTITATSNNQTLIPNPSIVYANPQATGQLKFQPNAGQAGGTATITVTVADDGGTDNNGIDQIVKIFNVTIEPVNVAPTINEIPEQTIVLGTGEKQITLSGISAGGGQQQGISITATSSFTALVPNPTVVYSSPNSVGILKMNATGSTAGDALITLTVTDNGSTANGGVNTFSRQFTVHVLGDFPNQPPTLADIEDLIIEDDATYTVNLSGISAGGGNTSQNLTIKARVNDTTLLEAPIVNYTNPNTTGTISLKAKQGAVGVAIVTVSVQDDGGTAAGSFDAVTKTFSVTLDLVNAIEDLPASAITLYPNPNEGKFWLDTRQIFRQDYQIIVYDAWGKIVKQSEIENDAKPYLTFEQLPKGSYILEVRDRNKRVVKRWVKQ